MGGRAGTFASASRPRQRPGYGRAPLRGGDAARGEPGPFEPERLQSLQRPPEGGEYASGWMVLRRDWARGPILTHNGTNTLWYSVVWMAPSRDWVMAAVTNQGGRKAAQACDEVIGFLYIGTREGPSKLLSDEPLESLVSYF